MKRRLSAVLLALGLTVSALSTGVYAAETETTAATEQVTEAAQTEAATEKATEAQTEAAVAAAEEELTELASEAAEAESAAAEAESESETEARSQEEQQKQSMAQMLAQFNNYTDEQLDQMLESDNASTKLIAANWSSVKEEVGNFVEVTRLESSMAEDGSAYIVTCHAKYEKTGDTDVVVTYEYNMKDQSTSLSWDIQYSMGKLIERAGLNTVMGIGIVFLALLFLSFLIGRLHIIPDLIEKKEAEKAPVTPAAPAPVAAPAVEEEEDLMDDLELVAVITAAIAASETTSGDGFVVRSIKKANRRNWQRA